MSYDDWKRSAARHSAYVSRVDRRRARELLARAVRGKKSMSPTEARKLYDDLTRALRHLENYGLDDPRNTTLRRRISAMLTSVRRRAESARDCIGIHTHDNLGRRFARMASKLDRRRGRKSTRRSRRARRGRR